MHLPKEEMELLEKCGKSFDRLVLEGKYDRVHPEINSERFPILDFGRRDFFQKPFRFQGFFYWQFVVAEMEKEGYRPANVREALVFGALRPQAQIEHTSIVALGAKAKIENDWRVFALEGIGRRRTLDLEMMERCFDRHTSFLGVRK
ncbi:MAG: hypothetical protein IT284_00585 [Bacteroidetes bacterium]|nr:hypothetical protein [Bacteroidota bacterium]